MEIILHTLAPAIMFLTSIIGLAGAQEQNSVSEIQSVELGISETSPRGPEGGFAMPASGCSTTHSGGTIHECGGDPEIEVDPFIIRSGETATVTWDTNGLVNCELIGNLANAGPVGFQGTDGDSAVDAPNTGSEDVSPTSDSTYTISCDGTDAEASALLRVLPRIQET